MVPTTQTLIKKYQKLIAALATLKAAIDDMKNVEIIARAINEYPEKIHKTYRDSLIQRFEYTFDLSWKYVAEYLEVGGKKIDPKVPKMVFRECFKANIINEEQTRLAMNMVDHRNLTTHGYDEPLIEEISQSIPNYYNFMEQLATAAAITSETKS
jgi:nucleotidyltransferase substrate binding protein (TIGR01987 family)